MNNAARYQHLQRKALGLAFILGPLLMLSGALVFLLGIGITSYGVSSWVEGILLAYSLLLFVPIYFGLAGMLGERAPHLGLFCAVAGLGMGFGVIPAGDRIMQAALDQNGYDVPVFSVIHPGSYAIVFWLFLGMFTSLFLGIGFLRYGGLPRWTSVLLILAPIFFVMGQGGDETIAWWQVNIMYPLACLTWLAALGPVGWRLLKSQTNGSGDV